MNKINVYIIARISQDFHSWTNQVCLNLGDKFNVFKPKDHNPWNKTHRSFPKKVFDIDLEAIKNSHIGLMLPEYGRDCAWESGWYANSQKPLVVFVDNQMDWLRDWMVKGGVDYVVTNNPHTWTVLKHDPILKEKPIILIDNIKKLKDVMVKIYQKHYSNIYEKINQPAG